MPGPFIARRVGGTLFLGFVGRAARQRVTCLRCGDVSPALPAGLAERWALGHLEDAHGAIYASQAIDLYARFEFSPPPGTLEA